MATDGLRRAGVFVNTVEGQNVLIFTAGEWVEEASIKPLLATSDFVVACDGALQSCIRHTIQPDLVIGDFDSVPGNVLNAYVEAGGLTQHVGDQSQNDLAKALQWIGGAGPTSCTVIGATGGDPQQEWANMLTCASQDFDITCLSKSVTYRFMMPGIHYSIDIKRGAEFSLFALPEARNIHLNGAMFELNGGVLKMGSEGLHNVAKADRLSINYESGRLALLQPRPGLTEGETTSA